MQNKTIYILLGLVIMMVSYFFNETLNHSSNFSNFVAVGMVGFLLLVLGLALSPMQLEKLSTKIFTIHVAAALVTIVIANAMGWLDTDEVIEDSRRLFV